MSVFEKYLNVEIPEQASFGGDFPDVPAGKWYLVQTSPQDANYQSKTQEFEIKEEGPRKGEKFYNFQLVMKAIGSESGVDGSKPYSLIRQNVNLHEFVPEELRKRALSGDASAQAQVRDMENTPTTVLHGLVAVLAGGVGDLATRRKAAYANIEAAGTAAGLVIDGTPPNLADCLGLYLQGNPQRFLVKTVIKQRFDKRAGKKVPQLGIADFEQATPENMAKRGVEVWGEESNGETPASF